MSNNYFERLGTLARKLDKGIKELEDAWQLPRIFVGGFADVTEETEERLESLKNSMQCTQDGVNELIRVTESSALNVDTVIKNAQVMYDSLKQEVDNLETVFKEYGYRYDKDSIDNPLKSEETETMSNSNCFVEQNSTKEIVFTPDLSWRCKKKSIDETSLNGIKHLSEKNAIVHEMPESVLESKENKKAEELNYGDYLKESVNTPLHSTQLQSMVLNNNAGKYSTTHKQFLTPLRNRPSYQIYSKHFYSTLKKDFRH